MDQKIGRETKRELLEVLRSRYRGCLKKERSRILDEFIAVSGYHRKHAIRLLGKTEVGRVAIDPAEIECRVGQRIYDEAVREALVVVWEAGDRICGKRLKAILPDLVDALERHGHLSLDSEVKKLLLRASAATIDRLLIPIREQSRSNRKRKQVKKISQSVPVRTFGDWNEPGPGFFEIDFVAHSGGCMADSFIHTLVMTDVCTGWTECIPLLVREQSLVVEGLDALFRQIPFPIRGIDSDNDGAFINETLFDFSQRREIEFTRCRAYHKNDQAWVEQKNGAVVRRLVGHERFSGVIAGQALAHLYQSSRLHVNFFQPSFKLLSKSRIGAKQTRKYESPATPCARLLRHPDVEEEVKERLRLIRMRLDPLELLHRIREGQSALAKLASKDFVTESPGKKTFDQFLSQLPDLWKSGEVRPTHRKTKQTSVLVHRKDPFEDVWFDVLQWLQETPDETAKNLFQRLQSEHPDCFPDGQLRTFQRRIRDWRRLMAKKLVYSCMNGAPEKVGLPEAIAIGPAQKGGEVEPGSCGLVATEEIANGFLEASGNAQEYLIGKLGREDVEFRHPPL